MPRIINRAGEEIYPLGTPKIGRQLINLNVARATGWPFTLELTAEEIESSFERSETDYTTGLTVFDDEGWPLPEGDEYEAAVAESELEDEEEA